MGLMPIFAYNPGPRWWRITLRRHHAQYISFLVERLRLNQAWCGRWAECYDATVSSSARITEILNDCCSPQCNQPFRTLDLADGSRTGFVVLTIIALAQIALTLILHPH